MEKPTWEDYYRVLKGRADGNIPDSDTGLYLVTRRRREDKDASKVCVKQVTPVAAALERAENELKKSIKGTSAGQNKSKPLTKGKRIKLRKRASYPALGKWQAQLKKR